MHVISGVNTISGSNSGNSEGDVFQLKLTCFDTIYQLIK